MVKYEKELTEEIKLSDKKIEKRITLAVNKIEESLEKKNYVMAVLYATTTIEFILFNRLNFAIENKKYLDTFKRYGLGTYKKICEEHGIIDKNELTKIEKLIEIRNKIAHDRYYIMELESRESTQKDVEPEIKIAIDFIHNNPIYNEEIMK